VLFRSLEGMNRFRWGSYQQIPQMIALARKETDRLLTLTGEFRSRRKSARQG